MKPRDNLPGSGAIVNSGAFVMILTLFSFEALMVILCSSAYNNGMGIMCWGIQVSYGIPHMVESSTKENLELV